MLPGVRNPGTINQARLCWCFVGQVFFCRKQPRAECRELPRSFSLIRGQLRRSMSDPVSLHIPDLVISQNSGANDFLG